MGGRRGGTAVQGMYQLLLWPKLSVEAARKQIMGERGNIQATFGISNGRTARDALNMHNERGISPTSAVASEPYSNCRS